MTDERQRELEKKLQDALSEANEALYELGKAGIEYFDGNEEKHSRTSVVGWLCLDTKKKEITVLPF